MLKFTEFAFDSICSIQDDLFAGNVDREKLTCSIKQITPILAQSAFTKTSLFQTIVPIYETGFLLQAKDPDYLLCLSFKTFGKEEF